MAGAVMRLQLQVTPAEWAPIEAAGSGALFREGVWHHAGCETDDTNHVHPPAEFVKAAQPCEHPADHGDVSDRRRCLTPGCDGKRRVAVVVPCDVLVFEGPEVHDHSDVNRCPRCDRTGVVTVGHVVVTWGPLVVVDTSPRDGGHVVLRRMWAGTHWDYRLVRIEHGVWQELTLPPDIDTQTLIGQYAIGVKVVRDDPGLQWAVI